MNSRLADLKNLLERLLGELALASYRRDAGIARMSERGEVIRKHNALLDPALFDMLAEESERSDEGERDGIAQIRRALVFLHLDEEARNSDEQLRERMGEARIWVGEEEFPFRDLTRRIAGASDRRTRALLARAREKTVGGWEPILRERIDRLERKARDLGYEGYGDLLRAESGIDLQALEGQLGEFLARTQDIYRDVLFWLIKKRLGIDPAETEHHDLIRAFRGEEFDGLFPGEKVVSTLAVVARSLQIDLQAEGRLQIDLEDRPGKQSRPFVARVMVPDQIILSAPPGGGHALYRTLLHELGHALHFAYTGKGVSVPGRVLGDSSVTEAFAFTLERLVREPAWLRRFLDVKEPSAYVQFATAYRLYRLRRMAARFRYEMQLYGGEISPRSADAYRVSLSEACLSMFPRALYLFDLSRHLYSARHLQGWILEAMLHRHLVHYFEEDWFRNPRAGAFLLRLWNQGQESDAGRVSTQIGYPALDLQPLIEDLEAKF